MLEPNKDTIVVLDCGGQYAHLIANRIRRENVFSEICSSDVSADDIKDAKGIIISGGPSSVYEENSPKIDTKIFDLGIPVLGICYGHQMMIHTLGGEVKSADKREYGRARIQKSGDTDNSIFQGLSDIEEVWMSHGDEVKKIPDGFEIMYSTKDCPVTATAHKAKHFYSVQFHPEVTHTVSGNKILKNFIEICKAQASWTMEMYIREEIERIQNHIGEKNVFLLTSGGVDSTVAFALLSKALGKDRVYGLFVDTGFMRKGEITEVSSALRAIGFDNLHVADAKNEFYESLKEIYDPERKRNIIGAKFLEVKDHWAEKLGINSDDWILGQGTIYPDTIESGGTKNAETIKTHHNRIDQIEKLIQEGRIIEPLKELYKDEVRELGEELGLPASLVWRHPFPGPGLAIRMLCAKNSSTVENAKDIEQEVNAKHNLASKILPMKSVGVQGDGRTYEHPIALFDDKVIDWSDLDDVSTEITNSYREVNRVMRCLSHDTLPENISVIDNYLTEERVHILQEIDAIVRNFMEEKNLQREIWQFPVILAPVSSDGKHESIILRPVHSSEAMTADFGRIQPEYVQEMTKRIQETGLVSMIFYDLTNKPPGTIEWE